MGIHKMNDGCVERALNEIIHADRIRKEAVYTGYKDLDRILGGMLPGELYLIGSRPAMGKSIFTYNLLRHMCVEKGTPAVLFSTDASAEVVLQAMLKMMTNRVCDFFRPGALSLDDLETCERAAVDIHRSSLIIDDTMDLTPDDLIKRCREIKKENPIRIIFLNSWESIHFPPKASEEDMIETFRQIKSLTRELKLTIVINMNLSREIENREDHYPKASDFMIPAEALDEADGVMAFYREAYYGSVYVENGHELIESFEVIIFRSRKSKSCFTNLIYRPDVLRIDEWNGETITEVHPLPGA